MIEVESCIHLTHPRCWNSKSELKTPREQGVGLGQITRAYNANGSIRFDALSEIKKKYPKELTEVSWTNIKNRPDLQIRITILKMKDNYTYYQKYSSNNFEAYAFADASYNGGIGGLDKERRACKLSGVCDPSKWFFNVENFCLKSRVSLYGNRSACQINREHTKEVLLVRAQKYEKILGY